MMSGVLLEDQCRHAFQEGTFVVTPRVDLARSGSEVLQHRRSAKDAVVGNAGLQVKRKHAKGHGKGLRGLEVIDGTVHGQVHGIDASTSGGPHRGLRGFTV